MKRSVGEPRYAWGGETHHSVGKITDIESNCLLIIEIPNRSSPWQADPSDMEKVESFKVYNGLLSFIFSVIKRYYLCFTLKFILTIFIFV